MLERHVLGGPGFSPVVWDNTEDVQATFPEDTRALGESAAKLLSISPPAPWAAMSPPFCSFLLVRL